MQSRQTAAPAWSVHSRRMNMLTLLLDSKIKEEVRMKYINAKTLLPEALLKELQNYIQGGYIYIPAAREKKKHWGEVSGYRNELEQRNRQIVEKYQRGVSVELLSEQYCLSVHAIRKIIYKK